ncbi:MULTISPECIES: cytochrome c3 family protein [Spectribacter]|uniref:Cytochrome c3 family protein n=2 Tax=Spectribacter TaxID=3160928 RepID=A0ABU3BW23_9GAMM|nr:MULTISPECIES: cytochrome c3 family protein [unclassified Salinisphaera]MDT0618791.1 cytochrome c3 family protein [Salinisphaera sp. P385]MDT0633496.1 cytochrome c3 family protein [Salinisphaera sp. W335]
MLILVRKIRVRGEQVLDQRDVELTRRTLYTGRGKAQHLQLFGDGIGAEHAWLRPKRDGRLKIGCLGSNHIRLDEGEVRRATLTQDEWAWIGPHRVARIAAPPGFDAAIEVRIDADAVPPVQERLRDELRLRLPGTRRYSYLLAAVVAAVGIGLPLLAFYHEDVSEQMARYGAPTDQIWSSGKLANAHHLPSITEDCNVCHVEPFERVRNDACLDCHNETTAHFSPQHPVVEEFRGACRDCHAEHNEPTTLVMRENSLCTDCHAQEQERRLADAAQVGSTPVADAPATLPAATALTSEQHPRFLVSLLRRSEDGWRVHREPLDDGVTESASNLKFPHDLHRDHEKVSLADGPGHEDRALICADCHTLERDGEHFQAVSMEATCSGCHSLAFDDAMPDRQLPHGEPETLRTYLEEFYVRQAALQKRDPPPAPARRVPASQPENRRCEGDPLDCGLAWADQEMDKLFTKAGCVSCHTVEQRDEEWHVRPVRLVSDWFPSARFDHVPHLEPGNDEDDEVCLGCHKAEASDEAHDVLMPGLETCVECHGNTRSAGVALQCIDCHSFHRPGMTTMGAQ